MEKLFGLFILLLTSAVSWLFVLNKSARQNYLKPSWYLFKMNKEQRETDDAIALAVALVSALAFSMLLGFVLLFSLVRFFR